MSLKERLRENNKKQKSHVSSDFLSRQPSPSSHSLSDFFHFFFCFFLPFSILSLFHSLSLLFFSLSSFLLSLSLYMFSSSSSSAHTHIPSSSSATMNPPQRPTTPKLQGPCPAPLKLSKDSIKIKKPSPHLLRHNLPPPQQHFHHPVVIYTVSSVNEFMSLVQRLTDPSSHSNPPSLRFPYTPPAHDQTPPHKSQHRYFRIGIIVIVINGLDGCLEEGEGVRHGGAAGGASGQVHRRLVGEVLQGEKRLHHRALWWLTHQGPQFMFFG